MLDSLPLFFPPQNPTNSTSDQEEDTALSTNLYKWQVDEYMSGCNNIRVAVSADSDVDARKMSVPRVSTVSLLASTGARTTHLYLTCMTIADATASSASGEALGRHPASTAGTCCGDRAPACYRLRHANATQPP